MANKGRSREELKAVDALAERLREFVRLNYVTAAEIAREIGVNDSTVYSCPDCAERCPGRQHELR